jgi:hypothetical protein
MLGEQNHETFKKVGIIFFFDVPRYRRKRRRYFFLENRPGFAICLSVTRSFPDEEEEVEFVE